jgi:hypothetical protein
MATTKVMRRFVKGIILRGAVDADIASEAQNGSVFNSTATSRLKTYIQGAVRELITSDQVQTLSFKTLTNPTIDATSGVIILPAVTVPAQNTEGSIVWDSDDDKLTVGTGATRKTMVDTDSAQTVTNKAITFPSSLHVKQGTTATLVAYAATQPSGSNGQFCFATDTKTMYQIVDGLVVTLAGPASGENNTASSVGTGVSLFKQKSVFDLQFKTLKVSGSLSITPGTDDVTIGVVVPAGLMGTVVQVASSPTTITLAQDGFLFAVDTTIAPITLNLPTSPTAGIRYVIKCARGTCGVNPITVTKDAAHTIERLNANYLLESNFGSWTFVFNGVDNWILV